MKFGKNRFTLFILFLIIALSGLRFLWLDNFPVGISHDEMEYILSSKTYFLKGVDLSGVSFPLSIFTTKTEGIISFLVPIVLSPYYGLANINQFTARLPYVLLSLATAYIIFLLVKKLFNQKIALISVLVFLVNPWSYYLSRTAVDTPFALLFSLLGIYLLLTATGKKLIIPFVFFLLAFFSYHGAKPLIPLIIIICLFYQLQLSKSALSLKHAVTFFSLFLVIFFGYFFVSKITPDSVTSTRSQDLVVFNNDTLSSIVNMDRRESLESPLGSIFTNKFTVATNLLLKNYFGAFSFDSLFISGDNRSTYRFGSHGLFYPIDLLFIIIGLCSLFYKNKKSAIFLSLLVLVAPISTALSTVEISTINRSFLLLPLLIIFISLGINDSYNFLIQKIKPNIVYFFFGFIYLFVFSNFIHFYFFRYPIIGQENYFFSERIIANYLIRSHPDQKIIMIGINPREIFLETIFYSSSNIQKKALQTNLSNFINGNYQFNNVTFAKVCPEIPQIDTTYIINQSTDKCALKNTAKSAIVEERFGGSLYFIVNNQLCNPEHNQAWSRFHLVSSYSVENLDTSKFCQTWIKKH